MTGSISVDVFDVAWVTLKVTFLKSMIPKLMSSSIASSSPKFKGKKWIVITCYAQLPFVNLMITVGHHSMKKFHRWSAAAAQASPWHTENIMADFLSSASLENTSSLEQSRLLFFK